MSVDNFNRNFDEVFPVSEMIARLREPTTNQVMQEEPKNKNPKLITNLEDVVKEYSDKIGVNIKNELGKFDEIFKIVAESKKENKDYTKSSEGTLTEKQNTYLAVMAEATSKLYAASQSQNTLWVGIAHLTNRAQKEIAEAIDMSKCCGSASAALKSSTATMSRSLTAGLSKVASASSTATTGGGGAAASAATAPAAATPPTPSTATPKKSIGPDLDDVAEDAMARAAKYMNRALNVKVIGNLIEGVGKFTAQAFDIQFSKVWSGALVNSNKYVENLRAAVHIQQGFGRSNRMIEEQYDQITQSVRSSGLDRAKFQGIYLRNLERGLTLETESDRLAVKGLSIDKKEEVLLKRKTNRMIMAQTTAANTASLLGMSADGLNEIFMDWQYNLGLSNLEMGNISRHMTTVSKTSGLFGQQMEKAMQASSMVAKDFRASGIASADNLKKITEFMAASQKHGFEQAGDLMKALSSGQDFRESKLNAFLAQAASLADENGQAIQNLSMGSTLFDPKGMKNLNSGIDKMVKKLVFTQKPALEKIGITDESQIDPTKLSKIIQKLMESGQEAAAMSLQTTFKTGLKMDIGQVEAAAKSFKEMQKTPFDRLTELREKRDRLAPQRGGKKSDEFLRTEKLLADLESDLNLSAFSKFADYQKELAATKGIITPELKEKMMKGMETTFGSAEEAQRFLSNTSQESMNLITNLGNKAKSVGIDFKESLKGQGFSIEDIAQKLNLGDESAMEALQQIQQEIAIKEKAAEDPSTQLKQSIVDLNNTFQAYMEGWRKWLPSVPESVAPFMNAITGALSVISVVFGTLVSMLSTALSIQALKGLKAGLPGAGGVGGAGAAGAAGAAGGVGGAGAAGAGAAGGVGGAGAAAGAPKRGMFGRAWDKVRGKGATAPTTTVPTTPSGIPTPSPAPVTKAGGGFLKNMKPKGKLMAGAAIAATGYGLYNYFKGDKKEETAEGIAEKPLGEGDVLSVLRQIEINTRCLCAGKSPTENGPSTVSAPTIGPQNVSGASAIGGAPTVEGAISGGYVPGGGGPETKGVTPMSSTTFEGGAQEAGNLGVATDVVSMGSMLMPSMSVGKAIGLPQATSGIASASSAAPAVAEAAGGGFMSRLWTGSKNLVGNAYSSVKSGAASVGRYALDKTGISSVTEYLSKNIKSITPNFLRTSGKSLKGGFSNILNKIPLFGTILQALSTGMDINEAVKQEGISKEDLYSQIGSTILSSGLGMISGTIAAGMISAPALLGIPSWLLSPMAYMGGEYLGSLIGSAISDYVGGPALGKLIFDTFFADGATASPTVAGFEVGTKEITKGGLAELHQGEMVMPSRIWDKISAIGSGPFGAGGGIISKFANMSKTRASNKDENSQYDSLIHTLKELIDVLKSKKLCECTLSLEGAFEKDQTIDALESDMNQRLKMKFLGISEPKGLKESAEAKSGDYKDVKSTRKSMIMDLKEGITKKYEKFISLSQNLGTSFAELIKSNKTTSKVSISELGAFEKKESINAMEEATNTETNKNNSIGGLITSSLGGPLGVISNIALKSSKTTNSITDHLSETFKNATNKIGSVLKPINLGVFSEENPKEAYSSSIESSMNYSSMQNKDYEKKTINTANSIQSVFEKLTSNKKTSVNATSMGLFDPEKTEEAADDYTNNFINKLSGGNIMSDLNNIVKSVIISKQSKSGDNFINPNMLDYSDDMRGEVGTLGLSRTSAESKVAQTKYGEASSGNSSILPSMDSIADYLITTQAKKLDDMIRVMEQIRDKLPSGFSMGSEIIGPSTGSAVPPTRPGIKNIAKDFNRGSWDLTFGDYSPGQVTTDGRGGLS